MAGTSTGAIKFYLADKKYGFITIDEKDVFVHASTVEAAGFHPSDMVTGALIEVTIGDGRDNKPQAIAITRIGLQLAKKPKGDRRVTKSRPEPKSSPPTAKAGSQHIGMIDNYNVDRGFGFLAITDEEGLSNLFFHISAISTGKAPNKSENFIFDVEDGPKGPVAVRLRRYCRNQVDAHEAKKLFAIKFDGTVVDYEVDTEDDGNVSTESLDTACLATAREKIGKSIVHELPQNHGVKTNVAVKVPKSEPKKKKAA